MIQISGFFLYSCVLGARFKETSRFHAGLLLAMDLGSGSGVDMAGVLCMHFASLRHQDLDS